MTGPSARLAAGSLVAGAGVIAAATLASRVVGLGRWAVFSHAVGATCTGQVYATANQVPNVLFEVAAGGALAAVAVPLVAHHLQRGDEPAADRTASALLTWALGVLLPVAVLVAVLAGPIASALLGERVCQPRSALPAATLMLLLFAPQVVLYGVGIVLSGVLQAHRRFLAAALAPLASSLVVIVTYLGYGAVADPTGSLADTSTAALVLLAGGTTLGVVALSLPLLVPVRRAGVRLRPTWRFPAGTGGRARTLAVAGVLAVGAQQVTVLVTVWLSNRVDAVGVLNVYTYVQVVYLLPYAVLIVPLATAAFPRLTDPNRGAETLRRTLAAVTVVALASAVALVAARREVGQVFLALDVGAGAAGRSALEALPVALAAYAPGLAGFGLAALLTRALYVRGAPLHAAAAVVAGWAVAALLPLAVLGASSAATPDRALLVLGLGSSTGMLLTAGAQAVLVRRSWDPDVGRGAARVGAAALVGSGLVLVAREVLAAAWQPESVLLALLSGGLTGAAVLTAALATTRVLAPDTYGDLVGRLRR